MRIKLDYEDNPIFSTLAMSGTSDKYRQLMVNINGKLFCVWRTIDKQREYLLCEDYMKNIDAALIERMEKMLTKVFEDACAAVEVGKDLLAEDK
jgi:hypothetical protein